MLKPDVREMLLTVCVGEWLSCPRNTQTQWPHGFVHDSEGMGIGCDFLAKKTLVVHFPDTQWLEKGHAVSTTEPSSWGPEHHALIQLGFLGIS